VNEPNAVVEIGDDCTTGLYPFDIGTLPDEEIDEDQISQFVFFGDDQVSLDCEITITIQWHPETAIVDGDGNTTIPPTLVKLPLGGGGFTDYQPARFCNEFNGPTLGEPTCISTRSVSQGGNVPAGKLQVTEVYFDLGDPPKARN
jgi:hypothetical protein